MESSDFVEREGELRFSIEGRAKTRLWVGGSEDLDRESLERVNARLRFEEDPLRLGLEELGVVTRGDEERELRLGLE